jgi:hypothetical protein
LQVRCELVGAALHLKWRQLLVAGQRYEAGFIHGSLRAIAV